MDIYLTPLPPPLLHCSFAWYFEYAKVNVQPWGWHWLAYLFVRICGLIFSQIWIQTIFVWFFCGGESAIKNVSKKFGHCPKARWSISDRYHLWECSLPLQVKVASKYFLTPEQGSPNWPFETGIVHVCFELHLKNVFFTSSMWPSMWPCEHICDHVSWPVLKISALVTASASFFMIPIKGFFHIDLIVVWAGHRQRFSFPGFFSITAW